MTAQQIRQHRRAARRRLAFSLMELMIVVVITGVLAAIAVPTFAGYVQKSRAAEPVQFLGVIKLRQESFRSEFGSYLICPAGADTLAEIVFVPGTTATRKNAVTFPFPASNACFNQLGAHPDGQVRFGYGWAAGLPGTQPAELGLSGPDHWFVAEAVTDLDGDDTVVTFELTSHTRGVWIGVGGADWAPGWD